ncbi:hypothetical protein, partial [Klebsiella aerogenes]|uniref:hypothetical protein n=1 Tax=Klebsiella aerogenes TaxID=548 RepID=UPI001953A94C
RDCIAAMLSITDSRFQDRLVEQARDGKKVEAGFRLPEAQRDNKAERISEALRPAKAGGHCQPYPFGT